MLLEKTDLYLALNLHSKSRNILSSLPSWVQRGDLIIQATKSCPAPCNGESKEHGHEWRCKPQNGIWRHHSSIQHVFIRHPEHVSLQHKQSWDSLSRKRCGLWRYRRTHQRSRYNLGFMQKTGKAAFYLFISIACNHYVGSQRYMEASYSSTCVPNRTILCRHVWSSHLFFCSISTSWIQHPYHGYDL